MSIKPKSVLLIKAQKGEDAVDKYEDLLRKHNFHVITIKSLVFSFKNLDKLRKCLIENAEKYNGIFLSSPRCVEAVRLAVKTNLEKWHNNSNWVVGEATYKDALEKLKLDCRGKEAGNSENLAKIIVNEINNLDLKKPFLFPHGNLATNTLKSELQKHSIDVEGVLVYDTIPNPEIGLEIEKFTQNYQQMMEFVVFFSPSGVEASKTFLKKFSDWKSVKFIAIGPVTEKALLKENFPVFGVAKSPNPEELLKVINV